MSAEAGTDAGWVGREARQARLTHVVRRRRDAEHQVDQFREQLDHIGEQLKQALDADRKDYARELLSRRLSLRARLSEVEGRRNVLLEEEGQLRADPSTTLPES